MKKGIIGIVVGGGPAPGINGVISSATIEAITEGRDVIGISGGFKSLFSGDLSCALPLSIKDVSRIHTSGGSILGTSRDSVDDAQTKFKKLLATVRALKIRHLITIGGDGTAFMARWIEQGARGKIAVVHVPKTIDNDLYLPAGQSCFGYQTARDWGVEIVKNIMEDAKTTGRWYFITTMGRSSGHLALGIGKAAGATVTLIPEEFEDKKLSMKRVADILESAIIKRLSMGKNHGVVVLAEGISGRLNASDSALFGNMRRDELGRIRFSELQFGGILRDEVRESLESRGISMTIVHKTVGYELRAADPIPYDIEYTRNLGYGAVRFLLNGGSGAMIVFDEGKLRPVSFVEMTDRVTGNIKVRLVDINSENYEVGRNYMIRLEKKDIKGRSVSRLAQHAKLSTKEFKKRFSYLVE
jgi:6-phosphofructokinase 1